MNFYDKVSIGNDHILDSKTLPTPSRERQKISVEMMMLGADHVLNYKDNANWGEEAKDLTTDGIGAQYCTSRESLFDYCNPKFHINDMIILSQKYQRYMLAKRAKKQKKTYNSRDSLVVTHPTTNRPACGLNAVRSRVGVSRVS